MTPQVSRREELLVYVGPVLRGWNCSFLCISNIVRALTDQHVVS
jgi:hypothetical protein